ncbi:MAG: class I SAM-dependent methyltransferase [Candidatus Peribacteraceae bacterium]|nr:class I SAM-dependent methyltransferase [Candidatus Peribacteraceae bacterium]
MSVLEPHEYDISYFDGQKSAYSHNAGYTEYKRWPRYDNGVLGTHEGCTGEFFKDHAKIVVDKYNLAGKKVLELGSAYGFTVEDLRDLGVDAYGIDVSQYAYDQASSVVQPYLTVADARTELSKYKANEFDIIYSRWFLECISDDDLPDLVDEMNRISKQQVHVVRKGKNPDYYNKKTVQEWLDLSWEKGTVFLESHALQTIHKK